MKSIRFTWYKSDTTGKRVYEVWDSEHKRLIYRGCGYVSARKVYNRAMSEVEKLNEYKERNK